jgi:MFS family permease
MRSVSQVNDLIYTSYHDADETGDQESELTARLLEDVEEVDVDELHVDIRARKQKRHGNIVRTLGLATLNGALWSWSIFEERVQQTLDESLECQNDSHRCADYGSAPVFFLLVGLGPFLAPYIGPRLGKLGPRYFARIGTACVVTGFLFGALAMHLRSKWLLILGFAVPCGLGAGVGFITTVVTLVLWYSDPILGSKPGKGSGLQGAFQGGTAVVFSQVQYGLLYGTSSEGEPSSISMPMVFVILAVLVLACALPACIHLDLPSSSGGGGVAQPKSQLKGRAIVRTTSYKVFFVMLLFAEIPGWSVQSFMAPLLKQNLGFGAYQSACALSIFLAFFSFGRLTCGILGDKIGGIKVWLYASGLQSAVVLCVAFTFSYMDPENASSFVLVLVLCATVGVCFSAIKVSVPGVLAEIWGSPAHVSPVMGMAGPAIALSVLLGSVGLSSTGKGDPQPDAKNPFLYACCAMSFLSSLLLKFVLKPPPDDLPGLKLA